jgi:hypothetical protein
VLFLLSLYVIIVTISVPPGARISPEIGGWIR